MENEKQDVYTRITNKIVADLEQGMRTWMKRGTREHRRAHRPAAAAQRRALFRHQHTDALGEAVTKASALHLDDIQQALELNAHVRKGEKGSLVVYANTLTRTEETTRAGKKSASSRT